jgi:hypothetical protein
MNERPTPETDAAIADGYTFNHEDLRPVIAFCQRLERERDEALALLASKKSTASTAPEYFTDENGIRWLNVTSYACQCADCKVERELGLSLRTPKQCGA